MLTVISSKEELANCQRQFIEKLKLHLKNKKRLTIGHPGGNFSETVYFNDELWLATQVLTDVAIPRYWNGLGIRINNRGMQTIVVEINIPITGVKKRLSGIFAKDQAGNYYVLSRGKVGGGFPGIGKSSFKRWYKKSWVDILDEGENKESAILISPLESSSFLENIKYFVNAVADFKRNVKGMRPENAVDKQYVYGISWTEKAGKPSIKFFRINSLIVEGMPVNERSEIKGKTNWGNLIDDWPQKNSVTLYKVFNSARNLGLNCFRNEKKADSDHDRRKQLAQVIELFDRSNVDDPPEVDKNEFLLLSCSKFENETEQEEDEDASYQNKVEAAPPVNLSAGPQPPPPLRNRKGGRGRDKNPSIAKAVIINNNYQCAFDQTHKTFISKVTKNNYVEAHHLIPMNLQEKFSNSLDVPANIIPLCSNCHRKFHHAISSDRNKIIELFYLRRKDQLASAGIAIELEVLFKEYR